MPKIFDTCVNKKVVYRGLTVFSFIILSHQTMVVNQKVLLLSDNKIGDFFAFSNN